MRTMSSSISSCAHFSSHDIPVYSEINYRRQWPHQHQQDQQRSAIVHACCPSIHVGPPAPIPSPSTTSDYPLMHPIMMPKNDTRMLSPALSSSNSSYCTEQDTFLPSPSHWEPMHQPPPPPPTAISAFQNHSQQQHQSSHLYYSTNNRSISTQSNSPNCFFWDDFELDPSPVVYGMVNTNQQQQQQQKRPLKIHYCPICPHTSNRANNMKEHILTHDPARPRKFACLRCGKRFARKHDMKRHAKSPHHP